MLDYVLVTSFNDDGYKEYGKRFLEGFIEHFPNNVFLVVVFEGDVPQEVDPRISYVDIKNDKELAEFKDKFKDNPQANGVVNGSINYRYQAVKFSNKVAAITSPNIPSSKWRIWVDADVIVTKDIPETFFTEHFTEEDDVLFHFIDRDPEVWNHCEAGFVAYNTKLEATQDMLQLFRDLYFKPPHKVFELEEWHDSFVLDWIRKTAGEPNGFKFTNIAEGIKEFHPWPHTYLGEYMEHLKGPVAKREANKPKVEQPQSIDIFGELEKCTSRYHQLNVLVAATRPRTIVEVGTFDGSRAMNLAQQALMSHKEPVHYIGFDIFEDKDEEFNKKEYNGKKTDLTFDQIKANLQEFADNTNGRFTFELVRGNTLETLPSYDWKNREIDFVWLDGGHAVETIASDYNAVNRAKLIVFDDYYFAGVDTNKYGCNQIVAQLDHIHLPVQDTFQLAHGKQTIGLVATGPLILNAAGNDVVKANKNKMQIKTRNCVEDEVIQGNVRHAATYKDKVKWCPLSLKPNKEKLLLVGGSGSVMDPEHSQYKTNWKKIKQAKKRGVKIVAVKTSYDHVVKNGITPDYCVLLDPRDHVASSFKSIPSKETTFFISTMCDPLTWDRFAGGGYTVVGYHAAVGAGEVETITEEFGNNQCIVTGGTTAGIRGLNLFYHLGFRHFTLVGFDSCYETKPKKTHGRSEKDAICVNVLERDFITDPELIAQAQDIEQILRVRENCKFEFVGDGMMQHIAGQLSQHLKTKFDAKSIENNLQLYGSTIHLNNPIMESLAIESLIKVLKRRQSTINSAVNSLETFDQMINMS